VAPLQTIRYSFVSAMLMPQLGYGVYQVTKDECERCVRVALEVGYRSIFFQVNHLTIVITATFWYDYCQRAALIMQISSRFTMAIHMFACIDTFSDQKMTSDFMAASIGANPVIADFSGNPLYEF